MKGKIALITGGTSGIGDAICEELHKEGAFIITCGRNPEKTKKWEEEKKKKDFSNLEVYVCDVSDYESCKKMIMEIEKKHKRIDILVNNAGITKDGFFKKMSKNDWDIVMKTNLDSLYNITQPVINIMLNHKYGRIINISSVNGQKGQFGQVNYSASKAGVHGFTKALAQEVATKNITVNTISPGYIDTEMVRSVPEDIRKKIIDSVPSSL